MFQVQSSFTVGGLHGPGIKVSFMVLFVLLVVWNEISFLDADLFRDHPGGVPTPPSLAAARFRRVTLQRGKRSCFAPVQSNPPWFGRVGSWTGWV